MVEIKDKKKKPTRQISPQMRDFVHAYLGMDEGDTYSNATQSYIKAYDLSDKPQKWHNPDTGLDEFTDYYWSAKTSASQLLSKPIIKDYMDSLLSNLSVDTLQVELQRLVGQNKNLQVKHSAINTGLKVKGAIKEQSRVEIPELVELTNSIKSILSKK